MFVCDPASRLHQTVGTHTAFLCYLPFTLAVLCALYFGRWIDVCEPVRVLLLEMCCYTETWADLRNESFSSPVCSPAPCDCCNNIHGA